MTTAAASTEYYGQHGALAESTRLPRRAPLQSFAQEPLPVLLPPASFLPPFDASFGPSLNAGRDMDRCDGADRAAREVEMRDADACDTVRDPRTPPPSRFDPQEVVFHRLMPVFPYSLPHEGSVQGWHRAQGTPTPL